MNQTQEATWTSVIGEIQRAEHALPPDELWAVTATQDIAALITVLGPGLDEIQRAALIGVGAAIARQANRECMAALQAELLLSRLAGA